MLIMKKTELNKILAYLSCHSAFFRLDFFPQFHYQRYFVSFLYEVAIGTRIVHTLVQGPIYASLRTSDNVDVSKWIISIVLAPQLFL